MSEEMLSPQEEALVESVPEIPALALDGDNDETLPPYLRDDYIPAKEKDGQLLLPEESIQHAGKCATLEHDIVQAYKSVLTRLKAVGDHAKYFKKMADYIAQIEPSQERDVIRINLKSAQEHNSALAADLTYALEQMEKVESLEAELNKLTSGEEEQPPVEDANDLY